MKKLLAVIVAALMLGSFAITASAADLANYAKDATATEWAAGETEGTQTVTYDLGGIKPLGYFQIRWGENVPTAFTVSTSSDNSTFVDQYTTTDNTAAATEIEVAAATSRYVKKLRNLSFVRQRTKLKTQQLQLILHPVFPFPKVPLSSTAQ